MTISTVAQATGGSQAPAGLIEAEDAGEASLAAVDQPGLRLLPELRLRLDVSDRLTGLSRGVSPFKTNLLGVRKHRAMGMMVDYLPVPSAGFFVSAGWRKSPARMRWSPGGSSAMSTIYAPIRAAEPIRVATNIARRSPTVMAGWSGEIGSDASVGLSAGAMQEHGRAMRIGSAAQLPATGQSVKWSRVGALAQVNFQVRF